ncbi:MAG: putative ABC transporter permease [Oscillospiraceae bacterium]
MWDMQMFGFSLYEIFWYFVLYSFLGWCVEVCFCSIYQGKFVNRGFLNGPICPIYGFGMVIVLVCLLPVKSNLIVLYFGSVVLTSLLELVAGFILKKVFHTSWWDYSDLPYNLGGYICLSFSLAWGIGGVAAVKLVHPLVAGLVNITPPLVGKILAIIVFAAIVCDMIVTINTIAKLNRDLGRIAEVAEILHKGSDVVAEGLGTSAISAGRRAQEGIEDLEGKKVSAMAFMDMTRAELLDKKDFARRRLLSAFPHMKHMQNAEALQQLKAWYEEKKK